MDRMHQVAIAKGAIYAQISPRKHGRDLVLFIHGAS